MFDHEQRADPMSATRCQAFRSYWHVPLAAPILILTLMSSLGRADSKAVVPTDPTTKARALIRSMADARKQFTSGVARFWGRRVEMRTTHAGLEDQTQKIDGFLDGIYAFDAPRGLLRYDITEPDRIRAINANDLRGLNREQFRAAINAIVPVLWDTKLRYVRNHDYCASWTEDGSNIFGNLDVRKPDGRMGAFVARRHHVFDLRGCGLVDYRQFTSGALDKGEQVGDAAAELLRYDVKRVSQKENLTTLTLESSNQTHRLVIDANHGLTPVEYVVKSTRNHATSTSEVTWRSVANVWVPTTFSIKFDFPEFGRFTCYEFAFDWTQVNTKVDPDYFDFKTFADVRDDVFVVDMRQPNLPVLGKWINGCFVPQ
jgi:hypothetical protein